MAKADEIISNIKAKLAELGIARSTRGTIKREVTESVLPTERQMMEDFIIKNFGIFNPWDDAITKLPNAAGNYVFLLKKNTTLPMKGIDNTPVFHDIEINGKEYQILYTGIASKSLRQRIGKNHFGENAGRSTLRLSLGSLMGFTKIYRDGNGKHLKLKTADEQRMTEWMQRNLVVLFYANSNCKDDEEKMIVTLNPPLNLDKNHCSENAGFRAELSHLRSKKVNFKPITEGNV